MILETVLTAVTLNVTTLIMFKLFLVIAIIIQTIGVYGFPQYRPSYAPGPMIYPAPQESSGSDIGFRAGEESEYEPSNNKTLDPILVNRVSTWPREKQPFWYINQQKIAQHNGLPSQNQS